MPELKYKARMQSPQGKPRVYFSCHPEDFQSAFETLSEEILKISDCAIFYYDPDEDAAADEDYYLNLGQMQLFVMPVTGRLLTQSSRAMDTEFPFAAERHIPVLPIMLERDLEADFSRKCGELQFLDRTLRDATAIPYEEKLKTFLRSVLIGDELAVRVRAAFDAYIFLSYRKKDRKYAQELMRLIHKNEFCRSIAIWYDEFLTPGENFEQAIEDALKKSRLFALAVTPNLVNEDNYVMQKEYPAAIREGKHILPVELVKTDRDALAEKYAGLPDCMDSGDREALSRAMLEALRGLAIRENGDPAHNFLLGLAYLSGIDVEVDHGRAAALITGAAEMGLTEAMEKLAAMYGTGDGVERDHAKQIEWLRNLTIRAGEAYEAERDDLSAARYSFRLYKLGEAWYGQRQLQKARDCMLRSAQLDKELYERSGTDADLQNTCACYDLLEEIERESGNLAEAMEFCRAALRLREERVERLKTREARKALVICYERLRLLALEEERIEEAGQYAEKTLEIRKELIRTDPTPDDWRSLSIAYEGMGDVSSRAGDPDGARKYHEAAAGIRERLAEELKSAETRWELTLSLARLGAIAREQGELEKAEALAGRTLKIREELFRETGAFSAKRELANSLGGLGRIRAARGDIDGAIALYRKALPMDEELFAATDTPMAARDLSICCNNLRDLYEKKGDRDTAVSFAQKGLAAAEKYAAATSRPDALRNLQASLSSLGDYARELERLAEAREYYDKLYAISRKLSDRTGLEKDLVGLVNSLILLGEVLFREGRDKEGTDAFGRAMAAAEAAVQKWPNETTGDRLATVCYLFAVEKGDVRPAQKAAGIWTHLQEAHPENALYEQRRQQAEELVRELQPQKKKGLLGRLKGKK